MTIQQIKHFNTKFYRTTDKLIRYFFRSATVLFLVLFLFNTFKTVHAHNTHSWEHYFSYYKKGDCKKLLQSLKHLSKPNSWADKELYDKELKNLAKLFNENFKRFEINDQELLDCLPKF